MIAVASAANMVLLFGSLLDSWRQVVSPFWKWRSMAVDDRCCPHSLLNLRSVSVDFIMWSLSIAILSEFDLSLFSRLELQRTDNPFCIAMRESDVEIRRVKSKIPTVGWWQAQELIALSSHYLFSRLTMVRHKDIDGSWAYFLSLFDIFIYDINSIILMSNLVSAVKSLLIELSSGTKYNIYPLSGASNIIIIISRSWNDSFWSSEVLMLLGIHVQTF